MNKLYYGFIKNKKFNNMFKVLDLTNKDLIAVSINGKIEKKDYDKITPLIEKTVKEYGKVKLYIQINNIGGIEPKAFMEDVKTYFKHFDDISKIAVVGETSWHKLWTELASPFISGEIEFFSHSETVEARDWVLK